MFIFLALLLFLVTLPGTLELLGLTLAALFPPLFPLQNRGLVSGLRLIVIVPAYNEERSIERTLRSLKGCNGEVDILVVADNCTDQTATRALALNVRVFEYSDSAHRGKDNALRYALKQLSTENYDAYVIVDADTVVEPNFIEIIREAFAKKADAVQTCNLQLDRNTLTSRLTKIAMMAFNILRPLGREHLALSAGCFGNGFGISRATLDAVPWNVRSVVEDVAYHLQLVRAGFRVKFLEKTVVYAETPPDSRALLSQRSRWEGGRLQLLRNEGPMLLKEILKGNGRLLEPLMELMTLPLSFQALLLLLLVALPVPLAQYYGLFGLAVIVFHVLAALWHCGGQWRDLCALLFAPFYLIWRLFNISSLRPSGEWTRTKRSGE